MKRVDVSDLRVPLGTLIDNMNEEDEWLILTRDGKDIAALVTSDAIEFFGRLEDKNDIHAVEEAIAEGLNPALFEEFRKELGLD